MVHPAQRMRVPLCIGLCLAVSLSLTSPVRPQTSDAELYAIFDGDSMYTVLPANTIPAIPAPEFVTGEDAAAQMLPAEPVIGIVLAGRARAYSTWHLDGHEIVNDELSGRLIAATW